MKQQIYAPPKIHNAAHAIRQLRERMTTSPNAETAISLQSAERRQKIRVRSSLRLITNQQRDDHVQHDGEPPESGE